MTQKVRWGVLSTAKIGTVQVIPAMQKASNCEIVAIASRNQEKAQQAANDLGISKAYGSYEDLLADPEIDAIYNPLPNHMHVPYSIAALQAGKHVLCEKPIGLNSGEGIELLQECQKHPHLKAMEAFMYRFHPQWQKAKQVVDSGQIGRVRAITTTFSFFNRDAQNIRNRPEYGGGGLFDIGCYPISLSRFLTGAEPDSVFSHVEIDEQFQVDTFASVMMKFGDVMSVFTCSTVMDHYQKIVVVGEKGSFEIDIPFNAPIDRPCKAILAIDGKQEFLEFPVCSQYTLQGEAFANAVLNQTDVPTPLTDAIANMLVLEAINQSGKTSQWTSVPTVDSLLGVTN